jgi:hypothetical protein
MVFSSVGFIVSLVSCRLLTTWREVFTLYFQIDSIVPILISGLMGFYAMLKFLTTQAWY